VLAAVALLVWAALAAWPWFTRTRTPFTGTPSVSPFSKVSPVRLGAGSRACLSDVALEPTTRRVVLTTTEMRGTGGPLRVTLAAPGFHAGGTIAAGFGRLSSIVALVPAPPRSVLATLCVANTGRRTVALVGSAERRTLSRPATSVDGRPRRTQLTVSLVENRDASIRQRLGAVLRHVSAFRPFPFNRIGLALVALLVIVTVPIGVALALWRALDEDPREP